LVQVGRDRPRIAEMAQHISPPLIWIEDDQVGFTSFGVIRSAHLRFGKNGVKSEVRVLIFLPSLVRQGEIQPPGQWIEVAVQGLFYIHEWVV
jgi:hypothetical protein